MPKVSEDKPSQTTFVRPTPETVRENFVSGVKAKKDEIKVDLSRVTPVEKREIPTGEQRSFTMGKNIFAKIEKAPEIKIEDSEE